MRFQGSKFRVQALGFRDLEFGVSGLGLRVRVQRLAFRVWELEFRVRTTAWSGPQRGSVDAGGSCQINPMRLVQLTEGLLRLTYKSIPGGYSGSCTFVSLRSRRTGLLGSWSRETTKKKKGGRSCQVASATKSLRPIYLCNTQLKAHEPSAGERSWRQVLSYGQRHKVIKANILVYHSD
jgi:hypothetical protein